jgi:hypothetical protein
MSNDNSAYGRRSFMKRAGITGSAVGAGVFGIGPMFSDPVMAYSEKNYVWRKTDEQRSDSTSAGNGKDYANQLSTALVYYGSFQNNTNEWLHQFDEAAHALCREKDTWETDYSDHDDIIKHQVEVENQQPGSSSLFTPDNSRDVGSTPVPDGSGSWSNFGDAAFTAFKGAVGALHPALGAAILAADIVAALENDSESESGDVATYDWDYGFSNNPSDADHYLGFYLESDDTDAHFTVEEFVSTDMSYDSIRLNWNIYVDPYENLSLSDGSGQTITPNERAKVLPNRKIPDESPLKNFANGGNLQYKPLPVRVEPTSSTAPASH